MNKTPVVGKHGYSGTCDPRQAASGALPWKTFSVGCFEWLLGKQGVPKKGKVKVRISGPCAHAQAVYARASKVCEQLDRGDYSGPKYIKIPSAGNI